MVTLGRSRGKRTERPSLLPQAGGVLYRNWVAGGEVAWRTGCQGSTGINYLVHTYIQMCLSECPTTCISEQDRPPSASQQSIRPSHMSRHNKRMCIKWPELIVGSRGQSIRSMRVLPGNFNYSLNYGYWGKCSSTGVVLLPLVSCSGHCHIMTLLHGILRPSNVPLTFAPCGHLRLLIS